MDYQSLDFINFDTLLSAEQLMIRKTARDFVNKEVIPLLIEANRKGEFPKELPTKIGALGFLGANLKGYGCAGLDTVSYGIIMQEIERADSGIRSFTSVQGALCMWPIYTYGTDKQKEEYLPKMATGELIGCFGLTEPDFGSDPGGMLTNAKKVDGGYVLNGNKMWITNGCIADLAIVWAKLDGVVRGFIVEKESEGFTTSKIDGKYSLRVSVTSELHFKDCFVPDENILPEIKGLKGPLSCLNEARFGIAWGALGAANACYHTALNYTKERIIFKKPLANYQLVQAKLAKMVQEISKGQILVHHLAMLKEQGRIKPEQISLAKMNNCALALDCARVARDMLGANGVSDEYPIIRHMLNLESVNTYEGTEDIHKLIIGKEVTGLNAFF